MKDAYQLAIDSSHPQGPRGKWIKLRQLVADVDVPLATQKSTCTVLGLRIGASLYYSTANKVVLFWDKINLFEIKYIFQAEFSLFDCKNLVTHTL